MMPLDATAPSQQPSEALPFRSAEQAWLWTSRVLAARREGKRLPAEMMIRRCAPDDILQCIAQLYRDRKIDIVHAQVLRRWGDRGHAPKRQDGDRSDYRQWREALDRLEEVLRTREIVIGFAFEVAQLPCVRQPKIQQPKIQREKNKSGAQIIWLTPKSTSSSNHFEANRVGSLVTDSAARVSWPCTTKLLPLAVISPPNPDQLRVTPPGVTLSFLARSRDNSTLSNKEI